MFSPRSVVALLAVLALSAEVVESAIVTPEYCDVADIGRHYCLTCKTKALCERDGFPPVPKGDCTIAGEACTVLDGVATCRPIDETACSCDKAAQCDAYDPDSVLICLGGGDTLIKDCSVTTNQTCVNGDCDTSVCTGVNDDFVVITPKCTTAAYCVNGAEVATTDECASGTYFDMDEFDCMPIPPVPCAGCSDGACPDKSDCSKYYVCLGGVVDDEETCDVATPIFDISTNNCLATGDCTENDNCDIDLTPTAETTTTTGVSSSDGGSTDDSSSTDDGTSTNDGSSTGDGSNSTGDGSNSTTSGIGSTGDSTTTTSRPAACTAANVGQRYPYEGNCKMYVTCIQVSNGEYAYVTSTCLGDLVFDANAGYCDTPENVPECVLTSTVFF